MGQEASSVLERQAVRIMIWDVAITVPRVLQVYITSSREDADRFKGIRRSIEHNVDLKDGASRCLAVVLETAGYRSRGG